jgi:ubiquinone/menaquinone biosynthesis methyltransferase
MKLFVISKNHMNTSLITNKVLVPKEFNNVASKYDFATYLSQGYQEDLDRSAAALNLKGDERVLDLCCGTGKSSAAVLQFIKTGNIIGVDNSEGMLEVANQKFQKEIKEGKISFVLQDAMQLDFPGNSFDIVFMAYGLRNMPDYEKSLQIIRKVLKPGGKVCIHDYSLSEGLFPKIYWFVLGYFFIVPFCTLLSGSFKIYTYLIKSVSTFLTPSEITSKLKNNGFEKTKIVEHASWRKPILHTLIATAQK